jgi:hypothetical protein
VEVYTLSPGLTDCLFDCPKNAKKGHSVHHYTKNLSLDVIANYSSSFELLLRERRRAVDQAVSSWFPAAAARVRFRAEHVWFVVDKAALGQFFSECFGFPCQISFHQFLHHNHPGLAQ